MEEEEERKRIWKDERRDCTPYRRRISIIRPPPGKKTGWERWPSERTRGTSCGRTNWIERYRDTCIKNTYLFCLRRKLATLECWRESLDHCLCSPVPVWELTCPGKMHCTLWIFCGPYQRLLWYTSRQTKWRLCVHTKDGQYQRIQSIRLRFYFTKDGGLLCWCNSQRYSKFAGVWRVPRDAITDGLYTRWHRRGIHCIGWIQNSVVDSDEVLWIAYVY